MRELTDKLADKDTMLAMGMALFMLGMGGAALYYGISKALWNYRWKKWLKQERAKSDARIKRYANERTEEA